MAGSFSFSLNPWAFVMRQAVYLFQRKPDKGMSSNGAWGAGRSRLVSRALWARRPFQTIPGTL